MPALAKELSTLPDKLLSPDTVGSQKVYVISTQRARPWNSTFAGKDCRRDRQSMQTSQMSEHAWPKAAASAAGMNCMMDSCFMPLKHSSVQVTSHHVLHGNLGRSRSNLESCARRNGKRSSSPVCQIDLQICTFEVRCFKHSLDCLKAVVHKVQAGFAFKHQRTLSNVPAGRRKYWSGDNIRFCSLL